MLPYIIDEFFARNSDYTVCKTWACALDQMISDNDYFFEDSPESWKIAWIVFTYLGIWEGDGIGAIWQSDPDHISSFVDSLNKIGVEYSADFLSRSFNAIKKFDISNHNFLISDDFKDVCDEWNLSLKYYTEGIIEKLAIYLRLNRYDCSAIFDSMVNIQ